MSSVNDPHVVASPDLSVSGYRLGLFRVNLFIPSPTGSSESESPHLKPSLPVQLASHAIQYINVRPVFIDGDVLWLQPFLHHLPTHLD